MDKLRSFIYLDRYKIYSFSSQLFRGLTEYILESTSENKSESETQKGPIGSGKILADIIEKDISQTEKNFLHDHSYNLFEEALIKQGRVLEINEENVLSNIPKIDEPSFVKVTGKTIFNDSKIIAETAGNFNSLGEALGYVSSKEEFELLLQETKQTIKEVSDRNQKAKMKSYAKSKLTFENFLKEKGLNMDQKFLDHIKYLVNYGYNEQFEVQMKFQIDEYIRFLFSAILDRQFFTEDETNIVKKYSRDSEKPFTLFGIVTQSKNNDLEELDSKEDSDDEEDSVEEDIYLKEALMNVVKTITNVELTFTGRLKNEIIIDPIAVYREI